VANKFVVIPFENTTIPEAISKLMKYPMSVNISAIGNLLASVNIFENMNMYNKKENNIDSAG
jgi:hypothetical protein